MPQEFQPFDPHCWKGLKKTKYLILLCLKNKNKNGCEIGKTRISKNGTLHANEISSQ
jgi:hypothetical protein